jgi:hypothetical protein
MLRLNRTTLALAVMLLLITSTAVIAADEYGIDIGVNSTGLVTWNSQGLPGPVGPQGQ